MKPLSLKPVEQVEITTLMDNYVDLLLVSSSRVKRPALARGDSLPTETLVAEHGLSLLVKTMGAEGAHTILLDTAYNDQGLLHNMGLLDIDIGAIEAIVVSHGHMDHAGALFPLAAKMKKPVPLVVHPDIFVHPRILKTPDGREVFFPRIYDRGRLAQAGIDLVESKGPSTIADDTIAVTGEVERTTAFEKGMPNAFVEENGRLRPDLVGDDQSLIIHLRGKGLVLITGCCHAGIINTLRYAQKITGIDQVYAVLGGFHLGALAFTPVMDEIIAALLQVNPQIMVPMHCTGWNSIRQLAEAFPQAFVLNSVGSTYLL